MQYSVRKELDTLSKEVFGSSSRWQKLIKDGYPEVEMKEVETEVPGDKEGDPAKIEKIKVPVTYGNGAWFSTVKRYTMETVKEMMLERKTQLDKIKEMLIKQQEEKKKKEELEATMKKVQEESSGSAV